MRDIMKKTVINNRIIWILLITIIWYIFIFSTLEGVFSNRSLLELAGLDLSNEMMFVIELYLSTIIPFVGILVYTAVTKRNRFVFKSFLPTYENNGMKTLMQGLLVGFIMNFGCIVCALVHGDIKLYLDFALAEIPFMVFALVCVFIQSTSEELWCRGFIYERINVHYPLWVAIFVNGAFFAALHVFNPGATFLPILDIFICGLGFSIAKWYTKSIWFPMGIHTAWNFTQNFLFGLPNSGLVSEASVFKMDAMNSQSNLIYNYEFGVEGAIPAVLADALLGIICLILAAKKGRLQELKMTYDELHPEQHRYISEKEKAKMMEN